MPKLALTRLGLVSLTLAAGMAPGCGSSGGGPVGIEGGFCYADGTCNPGLVCVDELCVAPGGNTNTGGTGNGDAVAAAVQACFACGESQCTDEAEACSSASGCRSVLECTLACAGDVACANACDVSEVTEEGVQAMSAFSACVVNACVQECTTDIQDAIDSGGGSGGTIGGGGTIGSGGTSTGGTGGDGSGGTIIGAGGTGGGPGPNLILNGDFSQGSMYWNAEGHVGGGLFGTAGGEACFDNTGALNLAVSLGFPASETDAFTLQAGTTYTLSYTVGGYVVPADPVEGIEAEAKIGLAVNPHTTIVSYDLNVWGEYVTRSHTFTAAATHANVGFVFNFSIPGYDLGAYWVCFDDVSLRAQ